MSAGHISGFVWYPDSQNYAIVNLTHCQCCGQLKALPMRHKYCGKCGQHLLKLDPIDAAIAEMILEQENLLKRKYMRGQLNER